MMKRSFRSRVFIASILGLTFIASLSFSGCNPKKDEAVSEEGKTVVNMWVMPNSLEPIGDIEKVLEQFHKDNPTILVKITSVDWGAAWTKITTAATSGDVPDIVQMGSTWVGSISSMNALLDLSDRIAEIGGGATFVPVAWSTHGIAGSGQVTAIPWFVDARAMFYRKDVLSRAGLTVRDLDTWDSFERALKKIKKENIIIDGVEIAPLGIPGKNDWNVIHFLSPWIWGSGGEYLASDFRTATLNDNKVLKGVAFYTNLVRNELVPLEYLELNTAQVSSNFNNGACAIYFDGPYEVKSLTTPPGQGGAAGSLTSRNFGVAPYPKGPAGRFTFVGGSNLAIFKKAKNKEEAWKVIKYLTSRQPQVDYAKLSGFLPARRDAFDDPYFTDDLNRRVFKEAVFYGKTYPCIPAWGLLEPVLTRRFGIMWDYVTGTAPGYFTEKGLLEQLKLAKEETDGVLEQARTQ
jgi:multiple sugar transport system substrate-binding protein